MVLALKADSVPNDRERVDLGERADGRVERESMRLRPETAEANAVEGRDGGGCG